MRLSRLTPVLGAVAATVLLAACGSSGTAQTAAPAPASSSGSQQFPVTVRHALGTTTVPERPERVATVNWANQEVPLALGVVPVGMAAANFGDDDGDGLLPWVEEELEDLGGPRPVLFDETDGIDFEAVADTRPDLILAAYSGLTQQDYDTLSQIAPVVAYPEAPWATEWRDMIRTSSTAMGLAQRGDALVAGLEREIADAAAAHPELKGKRTMFLTHVDTTDLSQVSFYTTHDTRAKFFADLGLATPPSVARASATTESFSLKQSAEQVDAFDDVDIVVTYGGQELLDALAADPLLSKMPAVRNGAVVLLPQSPLGTAANPTPLSISWVLEDYVDLLAQAAAKTS